MYTQQDIKSVEEGVFPVLTKSIIFGDQQENYTHKITFINGQVCLCLSITDGLDWMNKQETKSVL